MIRTIRLAADTGTEIDYEEIKEFMEFMQKKGWRLTFRRTDQGWAFDFRKETARRSR